MDDLKFSIIMPVYRSEQYLEKCLDSVISQTYRNLEVILVHDGGEDASGRICDAYARRDGRITVVHRERGDVSSARNLGLDRAVGDYVIFADSDDWLEADFCEDMYKTIVLYGKVDIIKADYFIERGKTYPVRLFCREEWEINTEGDKELLQLAVFSRYYAPDFYCGLKSREIDAGYVWAGAYRRELLSGIRFQGSKAEDSLFNLYAIQAGRRIIYKPLPVYHYRQNDDSASFRYNPGRLKEYMFHYRKCAEFMKRYKKGRKFRISLSIRMANNIIAIINSTISHPDNPQGFAGKRRELKRLAEMPCYRKALRQVGEIRYFPVRKELVFALLRMKCYGAVLILADIRRQTKKIVGKLKARLTRKGEGRQRWKK